MTDFTNEPANARPEDVTPQVDQADVATEPIPVAYSEVPEAKDRVSISKKWLLIGGGTLLAVILLGGTFAAGAAVGSKTGRLDGRGLAMQGRIAGDSGMQQGGPGRPGDRDGGRGSGHQRGLGAPQDWDDQQEQHSTPQTPSSPQ